MNRISRTVQLFNFGLVILLIFSVLFSSRIYISDSWMFIGRLHPVILHLPIGLFFICFLFLPLKKYIPEPSATDLQQLFLTLTAFFALLSAQIGIMLAAEDGYIADHISDHKIAALIFTFGIYLFTAIHHRVSSAMQWIGLSVLGGTLLFAGHNGAVITHGEDFLFPSSKDDPSAMLDPDVHPVYDWAIAPILKKKCQNCHNERKSKGGLLLLDSLSIMKGGDNGAVVNIGNGAESKLVQLASLPMDDDMHMPPSGKPQLTHREIQLIQHWIDEGLSFSNKLNDYNPEKPFARLLNEIVSENQSNQYDFDAADPKDIENISSPYLSIKSLGGGSPALDVSFFVSAAFEQSKLNALDAIKDQMVRLSLLNMPIDDSDLEDFKNFKNLEKLNLNGTSISTIGLQSLSGLKKLKSLSLASTNISLPDADFFDQWPVLEKVFLSDTEIDFADVEQLRLSYPNITFHALPPSTEYSELSPPTLEGNKFVFSAGDSITFNQRINGARIKYTLDGTEPDSTNGIIYSHPLAIDKGVDIKVMTEKEGWQTSSVVTYHLYAEGLRPSTVQQFTTPNEKYPGTGPESIIDGQKAPSSNLQDQRWSGFREQNYKALFSFNEPKAIDQISFAYGIHIPAYVFPPSSIVVLAGDSEQSLKQIKHYKHPPVTQAQAGDKGDRVIHLELEDQSYQYYKIEATNLPSIPNWHNGKGEKGWMFIDEIFFYE